MTMSKVLILEPEPITVVEPGGLPLFRFEVHTVLIATAASQFRTPDDWKQYLIEVVLGQPLEGGRFRYDSSSLAPVSIIED